ncbi:MAG: hypothetical protein ACR2H2_07060 [Solirubrobacteraceae bacterium]
MAAHRELDRALDLLEEARPRKGVDPALRRRADELRLVFSEQRDDGSGCILVDLLDEIERMLVVVVVVDGDDGQVRLVAGDELGRLREGDGVCRDGVPERRQQLVDRAQRRLVFVGGEDAQLPGCRIVGDRGYPRRSAVYVWVS